MGLGSDGRTRLLWGNENGAASIWVISGTGAFESGKEFGPFAGWQPRSLGVSGSGSKVRLLWGHGNGAASLWFLSPGALLETGYEYGPFAGWSALSVK
jgi:hypothetical protein